MKHLTSRVIVLVLTYLVWLPGCASPSSTPQTLPWQPAIQQFSIKPVSPGLYQIDQFIVTYETLLAMLQREINHGHQPNIIIVKPIVTMHEEEIRIAELAEKYGLSVYSSGYYGVSKTSSDIIRWQAEDWGYGQEN